MKKWITGCWLILLFLLVISIFWYNEWRFSLPTPVPSGYESVKPGSIINLQGRIMTSDSKPVFIHFFNPDCPCSKFNLKHFKALVKQYGGETHFAVVVETKKDYTPEQIREKFGLAVPVIIDGELSKLCGVYSTPQAVILNKDKQLLYRGNYNRSRFCTNKNTNYAQIALETILERKKNMILDKFALIPYGCQLPNCSN